MQNKRNLEAREPEEQARFRDEMQRVAADPALTRDYLLRVSMIASLIAGGRARREGEDRQQASCSRQQEHAARIAMVHHARRR